MYPIIRKALVPGFKHQLDEGEVVALQWFGEIQPSVSKVKVTQCGLASIKGHGLRSRIDDFVGVPVCSVFLLGLLVLAIVAACASRAAATLLASSFLPGSWLVLQMLMSIWEALDQHKTTRNKNDITSLLFSLPCAQCGQERAHLGDLKFPQFVPRDVPNSSYENFLMSQILKVGQE
ncbi:hypothetical protein Tco_0779660 [Tanacetum coccineum]